MTETGKISRGGIRPYAWIVIAAAGLLLRLEYLREFSHSLLFSVAIGPDVAEYHAWAIRILSGQILPAELPIHAPLYPFFLSGVYSLFGISVAAARFVQIILNFGAWLLLYALLREQIREKAPHLTGLAELFLLFAMLIPISVYYQAELVCESLLLPLFSLLLFFRLRAAKSTGRKRLLCTVLSGFFCGFAVITHPMTLGAAGLLFLADALQAWKRKRGKRTLGCAFLAFLLPVVTVSAIHSSIAGRPVFIQGNGAFNLYLGHSPEADGGCWLRPGRPWREFHAQLRNEVKKQNCSTDALLFRKIAAFYRENPSMTVQLFLRKAALVFSPRELISGADPEPVIFATVLQKSGRHLLIALLPLALSGALLLCRRTKDAALFLPWFCWGAGLLLMQCLSVSSGRYRTAMFPCFYLLAAFALLVLGSSSSSKERLKWLLPAGLTILFAFCYRAGMPGWQQQIESHVLYAEAALAQGKPEAALRHCIAIRKLSEDDNAYAVQTGRAMELTGDLSGALAEYRKGADAGDIDGIVNCGVLYYQQGNTEHAGKYFARAVSRPDANANAFYNYGVYLCDCTPHRGEGIAAILRATEMDPAHDLAWNRLGAIAFSERRYTDAITCFEHAAALRPQNRIYLRNLMAAAGAAGENPKAEAVKAKLQQMNGETHP